MKWWLISDEDVEEIRAGLEASTHDANDFNCPDGWNECSGCGGDSLRERAGHVLDTGLHITSQVPEEGGEIDES